MSIKKNLLPLTHSSTPTFCWPARHTTLPLSLGAVIINTCNNIFTASKSRPQITAPHSCGGHLPEHTRKFMCSHTHNQICARKLYDICFWVQTLYSSDVSVWFMISTIYTTENYLFVHALKWFTRLIHIKIITNRFHRTTVHFAACEWSAQCFSMF